MTIIPDRLRPGDKVSFVAPGRKVSRADIGSAVSMFTSWGLNVSLAGNLHSNSHSYLAGSDNERLADIQQAMNDDSVKAIICVRGGYGSTRILDKIDFSPLLKKPKWIVGFSDVTAIHLKLDSLGVASIHGTMPILFNKPDSTPSIESLKNILFDGTYKIEGTDGANNRHGVAEGKVLGGNLSLIVDALGTSSEPDMNGAILIIEEIDEYLYKMDRMMTQLKRSGKLSNLQGLLVGHMTDIKDTELKFGQTIEQIVLNAVADHTYPVVFSFPSGHENPNLAWIHGCEGRLIADAKGYLLQNKYTIKA
jgi:muramoyltetrapeptide carboxypeptidase